MSAVANAPCGGAAKAFLRCFTLGVKRLDISTFTLDVTWRGEEPKPGQFFLLRPLRTGTLLGRPISVFAWERGSCVDCGDGRLSFLIAEKGEGTKELASLREGDPIELTGPLGNVWPTLEETGTGAASGADCGGKPPALVAGGIGVAPLAFFARSLQKGSYDFYAGFRSASFGMEGLEPRDLVVATEDGCEGCRGRIPDFLDPSRYSAVYACGPEPMLRAVAASCAAAGIPCYLSLERRMACGVGACLGCTVRTTRGNRRCCADGPVFPAEEIVFDE